MVYTTLPGRTIALNGKALVSLHIVKGPNGESNISPAGADWFARKIVDLLNSSDLPLPDGPLAGK